MGCWVSRCRNRSSGSQGSGFRVERMPDVCEIGTLRAFQAESNLSYHRARYYDANVGRFTSEDPIEFSAGEVNFYAYVRNDPISLTDPQGLVPCSTCKTFVRVCYLTAGAVGWGVRWGCRIVCTIGLKMPLFCTVACTALGAGVAGALQLACYAGYKACQKNCGPTPCSSGLGAPGPGPLWGGGGGGIP